jgi:hypothetical protein
VELPPGAYRVTLTGTPSEPVEITIEEGEEVALRVSDDGVLLAPGS